MAANINIGNPITLGQLLEFEVVFPEEKPLTPEEYMAGGSRDFHTVAGVSSTGHMN